MKKVLKTVLAVMAAAVMLAVIAVPAFAATPAPNFSSGEYVDLLPYMKETLYGKQKDDEDGVRLNLSKKSSGYTAKFNSQAVNYGVRFNYDFVNPEGTLYYQCVLDSEQDLWDSDNARIYGGPVIQLGYGSVTHNGSEWNGYFSLLFTEKDGIDLRFSDKIGNDLVYLGAVASGLKANYPDTNSKERGKKDYLVVVKMSKKDLTVWVNGVAVIDGVKFDSLYGSSGAKIPCTVENLEPGMHANATRTTIHDFRLYCTKADAVGSTANAGTTTPSGNAGTSNTTSDTTSSTISDSSTGNDNVTDSDDDIVNELVGGDEAVDADETKDYIMVRGEKVTFFNWLTPVIISIIAVFALGAAGIGAFVLIANRKNK